MSPPHERFPGDTERRLKALERRMANHEERFREFVNARRDEADRDSSADLSVHPGRLRVSLKNLPPWVYTAILVVALVLTFLAVLLGPVLAHHAPLPEPPGLPVPAAESPAG